MSRIVCPYCFKKFGRRKIQYRCSNKKCPTGFDTVLDQFWGRSKSQKASFSPGFIRAWLRGGAPVGCPACHKDTSHTVCPYCHNEIPRELAQEDGLIISVIGDTSSGKSNYITVLINELMNFRKGRGIQLSVVLDGTGLLEEFSTVRRYEDNFYKPLYKTLKVLSSTSRSETNRIPLIISLKSSRKKVHLVFYDTAGESYRSASDIENDSEFVRNSDGFIFLFDTFALDGVYSRIKDKYGLKRAENSYNQVAHVLFSFFNNTSTSSNNLFAKPVAFTFTKFDTVIHSPDIFDETLLGSIRAEANSPYLDGSVFDVDDIRAFSLDMERFLDQMGGTWLVNEARQRYLEKDNGMFFGVSALGTNPDANGRLPFINPYRVIDPLFWLLYKLGFPLSKKESAYGYPATPFLRSLFLFLAERKTFRTFRL